MTRPDLVLFNTDGFSTTAGAWKMIRQGDDLKERELTDFGAAAFFALGAALALGAAFAFTAVAFLGAAGFLVVAAFLVTAVFGLGAATFFVVVAFFTAGFFSLASVFGAAAFGTFFASLVPPDAPMKS